MKIFDNSKFFVKPMADGRTIESDLYDLPKFENGVRQNLIVLKNLRIAMRKSWVVLLVLITIVSCTRDGQADLRAYVESVLHGELLEVGLAWNDDSRLRVVGGSTETFTVTSIDGNRAQLVGEKVQGDVFDIVLSECEDFMTRSYLNQTQSGLSSAAHLRFDSCLKGVETYSNVIFSQEWAADNGGELLQSGCLLLHFDLPQNHGISSISRVCLSADAPVFYISNQADAAKSDKLELYIKDGHVGNVTSVKAYLATSVYESVFAEGRALKLLIEADKGVYSKEFVPQCGGIAPGKVTVLRADSKDWKPLEEYVNVTLLSYNVGGFKKSLDALGHYSYPEAAAVIRNCGADVVGLNEVFASSKGGSVDNQPERLVSELGKNWTYYFAEAKDDYYGNAIFSSPGVEKIGNWRVELPCTASTPNPDANYETRSLGVVEYKDFVFCVTHLDHNNKANRNRQIAIINEWVADNFGQTEKPVFLVGDMNCVPSSEEIVTGLGRCWKLISATGVPTYSNKCIDYIFVWKNDSIDCVINSTGVIDACPGVSLAHVSDHFPVFADLTIILKSAGGFKNSRTDLLKSENP